jgi:tetratricopeptide (TPR) repeat protein
MNNIGEMLLRLGRHHEALDSLGQALAIRHETGDSHGEGITEGALGDTCLSLGRFAEAVTHYRRALAAYESTARDHSDQAGVLFNLGSALSTLGYARAARDAWQAAIPVLDRNNDPRAAELRTRLAERQLS